jgi:excisionase family DNA binding protein
MTTSPPNKLTLSVDETALLLGISPGLVYELVRRGELTAIRLGRRILIPRHVVEALVSPPDSAA